MQLGRREGEAELVGGFQLLLPVDAPVHPAELDVGHQHKVLARAFLALCRLQSTKNDDDDRWLLSISIVDIVGNSRYMLHYF